MSKHKLLTRCLLSQVSDNFFLEMRHSSRKRWIILSLWLSFGTSIHSFTLFPPSYPSKSYYNVRSIPTSLPTYPTTLLYSSSLHNSVPSNTTGPHPNSQLRGLTTSTTTTSAEVAMEQIFCFDNSNDKEFLIELGRTEMQPLFDFALDEWQLQSGGAIVQGYNVIVSAPTGAGKTVVGEMALHCAFQRQMSGIYTTPLKALSNQKYFDLCAIFGRPNTGLSTGDVSINKGARVTVMTTEVYRKIAWRASNSSIVIDQQNDLIDNAVVVLDEFHFLGHPGRGGVWEESVIISPTHTQIVGLSATLANAQSLSAWMEDVTGRRTVLVEVPSSMRPVPLRFLYGVKEGFYPLFRDEDAGPGAPKGLLGYRGDGIPEVSTERKRKKGFQRDDNIDKSSNKETIPRGLQLNPALRMVAEKRLEKIDKAIERQKLFHHPTTFDDNNDDKWSSKRRVYQPNRKLTTREEKKERERLLKKEMRRSVPSLQSVVDRLQQMKLLPAIFFIFSRAGCEEAARSVCRHMENPRDKDDVDLDGSHRDGRSKEKVHRKRKRRKKDSKSADLWEDFDGRTFRDDIMQSSIYSYNDSDETSKDTTFDDTSPLGSRNWKLYATIGLLDYNQVKMVANMISRFNDDNEEITFDDDVVEQFLCGVGTHHAGMLPAHKSFVEVLFRRQLMQVVFATETLAAGINMPARSTTICSLAKRGDGSSMNLLETSNLLQMAGRAGRRGMDTDGTSIILATPFESHEDAWRILTDPIKPITSQFSPSYSLCVNLIARGEGKLDVAKQLVSKSFATWQKREMEREVEKKNTHQASAESQVLHLIAQDAFIHEIIISFTALLDRISTKFTTGTVEKFLEILTNRENLKKYSKAYIGVLKIIEVERMTLNYLEEEDVRVTRNNFAVDEACSDEHRESHEHIMDQIANQRHRVAQYEKEIEDHPYTAIASMVNEIIQGGNTPEASRLGSLLCDARKGLLQETTGVLSAEELCAYSHSTVSIHRKTKKIVKATRTEMQDMATSTSLEADDSSDDSWDDFLSIVRTLHAYGCLSTGTIEPLDVGIPLEKLRFEVSPSGSNIGMLGFENTLWCLVALGGAFDVVGASSKIDKYRNALKSNESDNDWFVEESTNVISRPVPQQEAYDLVALLKAMSPGELAGYVSSLITENSRGGGPSVVDLFHRLSPLQQRATQKALLCMERLVEVQKVMLVDENTSDCLFDISQVESVTAWASGCTWNEALEISGLPPGDLARTFSRVLDAVRQLASLPFSPIRHKSSDDFDEIATVSLGLDPALRKCCREVIQAINRYPVKDPLAFETQDEFEEENNDEINDPI